MKHSGKYYWHYIKSKSISKQYITIIISSEMCKNMETLDINDFITLLSSFFSKIGSHPQKSCGHNVRVKSGWATPLNIWVN